MRVTRRHSQKPVAALSDAERTALEQNYYQQLESWLSAEVDTGHPEIPTQLLAPTRRRERR